MGRGRFKWAVLIALCSGQFIMVLDSTVMNVSIEKVIEDLDTKVATMQLAIATYTLTTAALMMVGARWGTSSAGGSPSGSASSPSAPGR